MMIASSRDSSILIFDWLVFGLRMNREREVNVFRSARYMRQCLTFVLAVSHIPSV